MRSLRVAYALAVGMLPAWAWGQLPAESELPGQRRAEAALPAESEVPAYAAAVAPIAANDAGAQRRPGEATADAESRALPSNAGARPAENTAGNQNPPDAEPPRELPNEQTVPADQAAAPDADVPNNLPLRGSPDGIPWLRLNLRGHTAPLRALTFDGDGRLCTAGEDKTLVIWSAMPAAGDGSPGWNYERTVRWQIQRGTRGRIYALASSPKAVALAGEGAMGGSGEILLIDPQTGQLTAALNDLQQGHQQVVVALSFAPAEAGDALASLSMDGALVLWRPTPQGLWRPTRLSPTDAEAYPGDAEFVRRLLAGRTVSAVAAINATQIVAPAFARVDSNRLVWRLELYDQATGEHRPLGEANQAPHWDNVKALAVSRDGTRLASADGGGYVYLWDLRTTPPQVRALTRMQAWSLAFDDRGDRLIVGGDAAADGSPANVEVWDVANVAAPERLARFASSALVAACGLSPDGRTAAWTSGARTFVRPVDGAADPQELPAGVAPPLRVAFPAEQPYYHLGVAKTASAGGAPAIDHVFDTDLLRLDRVNRPAPGRWLPDAWLSNGWSAREEGTVAGQRSIWLVQGGARRSRAPLTEERHGRLTAAGWVPSRVAGAAPLAAAIGTTSGGIYLVTPAAEGDAPIVRQLRGHTAAVTSLAVSRDLRYLASSSLDGTVCVWPLAGLADAAPLVQRWGGEFVVREDALVADAVRSGGPVHFRGMRTGDQIVELRYVDAAGATHTVREPQEMLAALSEAPWETLMTFRFARGRAAPTEFQIYPAWQQLVSLFAADDGEWAYWHPAGFYDASFEGHKLFGWQINRGLEMLPDFFLAAQFRGQLERPGAMAQLLRRGSLDAAFRAAQAEPPVNAEEAIVNSYRLKPEVEILSPRDGDAVSGKTRLTARLSVDAAERLAPPKAFANGVVASSRQLVGEEVADGRRYTTYEWDLKLPADERVLLQVAAATENEVTAGASLVVVNDAPKPQNAKLFLLSVGVDDYRDAQIPRLTTAVKSTEELSTLLKSRTRPFYQMTAASLLDQRATKANWRFLTAEFGRQLARDAGPDDLAVVFLSGHGVQAPGEEGYQFVTADANYADVMAGRYSDCMSIADLAFLADVPCRKLIVLNTCHSGAVSPLAHRELKTAVRALQGDMMLTLAASGGEEEAVEGRFARRLLEALGGAADEDRDGTVSFNETVAFVERAVAAESLGDAVRQTPTAGPKELLPYVGVPLTVSDAARLSAGASAHR